MNPVPQNVTRDKGHQDYRHASTKNVYNFGCRPFFSQPVNVTFFWFLCQNELRTLAGIALTFEMSALPVPTDTRALEVLWETRTPDPMPRVDQEDGDPNPDKDK